MEAGAAIIIHRNKNEKMEGFKVQDCVRLIHGHTPDMTISEINIHEKSAKCFWYNPKTRKMESDTLPLSVIKHCPEKASLEDIRTALHR